MITKQDFIDYVDSFEKDKGEFSDEELYEIGSRYKELPLSERNWDWLVDLLGVVGADGNPKKGEAYRTWVKAKQYEDGTIKKNVNLISGKTIDDISFEDFKEQAEEIKRDLYIKETNYRDERNSYTRTLRDEARIQKLREIIKESIKGLNKLPEVKYIKNNKTTHEKEAVMLISDLHIGMQIDNFYNRYNVEIARARVEKYVNDTIELCKNNNVERLNVVNLGDLIHGLIHITARIEEEEDVMSQVMIAAEILSDALNKLQEAAPEVVYRSVTDNHSRAISSYSEHIEKENLGRFIDFYMKARLENTNVIFAEDNLDWDISMFQLLNGKKMICSHGHRDNINSIVQGYLGATKQYIDYICVGHFHESKMKSFQGAKVFVNGSLCGSDSYAQSKRLYGDPEQTLLIFDGDNLSINYIGLNIK